MTPPVISEEAGRAEDSSRDRAATVSSSTVNLLFAVAGEAATETEGPDGGDGHGSYRPLAKEEGQSMDDAYACVDEAPENATTFQRFRRFVGPGLLIAVGYMDPGNWSTDIAGGSAFNYDLLFMVALSSLIAMYLQSVTVRLGAGKGRDLAQACRDRYPRRVTLFLWLLAEAAIAACDLAEVIGSAIALNLLFGLPIVAGVFITSADVLIVLMAQGRHFRFLEGLIGSFILLIGACFIYELAHCDVDVPKLFLGLLPRKVIFTDPKRLYVSIGIVGATVMPHNLYLHSAIVQTRKIRQTPEGKWEAIKFCTIDSTVALCLAFFVNAAILIVSASAFYRTGQYEVAQIQEAHLLLGPTLGTGVASTLFAVALLAAGQQSTLTGTMAGQVVMEGFLGQGKFFKPWQRRLVTRLVAIVPAAVISGTAGVSGTARLLTLSQVILSLQLPFAIFPLVHFASDPAFMGEFVLPRWQRGLAWVIFLFITALNMKLVVDFASGTTKT